jgi:hypothetical protein
MRILEVKPDKNYTLKIITEDGITGVFDVSPYWGLEAFIKLRSKDAFRKVMNGKYFVECCMGSNPE